jgi:hypothetical protein
MPPPLRSFSYQRMEIPDIVRCIAALLPDEDRVCLALVTRTCHDALLGVFTPYKGSHMFHLAASKGSFRQAYWWLTNYGTGWTEDDAQLILRRLGEKGKKDRWPRRFLAVFSEAFHSMEDCIIEGRICASGGNVDSLLDYVEELLWNVCYRSFDWRDRDNKFSRIKLQMIIDFAAAEDNVALHHNLTQRFGINFPETQLPVSDCSFSSD